MMPLLRCCPPRLGERCAAATSSVPVSPVRSAERQACSRPRRTSNTPSPGSCVDILYRLGMSRLSLTSAQALGAQAKACGGLLLKLQCRATPRGGWVTHGTAARRSAPGVAPKRAARARAERSSIRWEPRSARGGCGTPGACPGSARAWRESEESPESAAWSESASVGPAASHPAACESCTTGGNKPPEKTNTREECEICATARLSGAPPVGWRPRGGVWRAGA